MKGSVAFVFNVYKEFDLCKRLINQIKTFFPSSDVFCIMDGVVNYELQNVCLENKITYVQGERLFKQKSGIYWIKRMFWHYLFNSNADYLIKVDPDTYLLKHFETIPNFDIAGSIYKVDNEIKFIHGGCTLYSRKACNNIFNSDLIYNEKYTKSREYSYFRFNYPYKKENEERELDKFICEDRIIGDLAPKLNLSLGEWNEVDSDMHEKKPQNYLNSNYFAIHAVKTLYKEEI